MRVAALYDIHGNVHALEAVLAEVGDVDLIVVGGDVVAGPFPAETFDRLAALGERCRYVRGNGDRETVDGSDEQSRWCASQLGERLEAVRRWPLTCSAAGAVFCHATPRSDNEIVTRITPDDAVVDAFGRSGTFVVGHTHVQYDRRVGELRVLNAGSVGWPYEDEPGARWALLDGDVALRTTEYDRAAAAAAIRESGYPDAEEAAKGVLEAPGADAATEYFEGRRGA